MGKNRQKYRKRDRRLGELQYDAAGKQVDDRDTEAGKSLGYKDIVRENKLFEEFYKSQGICPEDQWEEMMRVLRTDLPASFRITGTRSQVRQCDLFWSKLLQPIIKPARVRRACALRALGLLLADGTPTVGGGKTF